MEINRYAFESYKMYDSKTNDIIASTLDQDINEDADSLIAYWANLEEPIIKDEDLLEDWGKIVSKYMKENYEESPDYDDLINYLQNYNNPNWIVIENSTGLAFAPGSDTIIFVVDKDVVINEIES